ncbi:MAG: AI-2E family transporter [Ignavibacteria bacterium]|nr:AI-2E family transporter [Ignavibacteria bacterium]
MGTFLWICGVDFYLVGDLCSSFLDFIPNIGSLVVSVLVTIVMLLQFNTILYPLIILAVLILIQNLKGNIIEPKFFGHRLDLSPLLLLFSLKFW